MKIQKQCKNIYSKLADMKEKYQLRLRSMCYSNMPNKWFIHIIKKNYKRRTGNNLNLDKPMRFTEKVQWRKVYDNSDIYSRLSDKIEVRQWVEQKIGSEYLIPLLGKWNSSKEIDFESLPTQYVLKTNNGSRTNTIVRDKSSIDKKYIIKKYKQWLQVPFWCLNLEPHYKTITPCILAEKYMTDDNDCEIVDYKFYCFNGKPTYCQLITDRSSDECIDFFDMDWNHLPFVGLNPKCHNSKKYISRPSSLDDMINIASILSKGFAFVRVDLYCIRNRVYFGEMTFTPSGGYGRFTPDEWDYKLGELWDIQKMQINKALVNKSNIF